jgi:hypothetical protein
MYYIRKNEDRWAVHNGQTGKRKELTDNEVQQILKEFPNLRNGLGRSKFLTYYRNRIRSIADLP